MLNHEKPIMARRFRGYLPVIVDIETSGFNPKQNAVLEIAAVITRMDEDGRIEAAIARTEFFFRHMGVKTRLADYGLNHASVDAVVAALEAHGMTALGEQREVTPAVSRKVLEPSL